MAACQGQCVGGDIVHDTGAGGDEGTFADANRSDELDVAPDERAITDDSAALHTAVVIARDRSRTEVGVLADVGVAHVAQVRRFGAGAELRVFELHEIPDACGVTDVRVRPEVGERADGSVFADTAVADEAMVENRGFGAECRVDEMAEASDVARGADARVSFEKDEW